MTKLISVHTPKAGGTSLSKILSEAFGAAYLGDYKDDPADPLSERNINPSAYFARNRMLPDGVDCIHGHFHPGQFRADDVFLFTILRHPIDNIVSIYSFWKAHTDSTSALHAYFLAKKLSVLEMAQLPLLCFLYSASYFGGFDMARFDLIGRHECRRDALAALGERMGIALDATAHENATPPSSEREELLSDERLRTALKDILAEDIRFYERYAR